MNNDWYFSPRETRRLACLSTRQLHYWEAKGIIKPARKTGSGFATRRQYSYSNLVELRAARRLLNVGFSLQAIRRALKVLQAILRDEEDVSTTMLGFDGDNIVVRLEMGTIDLSQNGQYVLVMLVGPLVQGLRDSLHEQLRPTQAAA